MKDRAAICAAVAAGVGATCYVVARLSRNGTRQSARKQATSPFEYHVAVHSPSGDGLCVLAKVPKSGNLAALRAAVASALKSSVADAESLQLWPVLRGGGPARLGSVLTEECGIASFEGLLAQQPSEHLQVVELLCAPLGADTPLTVPPPPRAFPVPGRAVPFLGHTYLLLFGGEVIPHYNFCNSVFPPDAPKYPYGPTVRSYNGGNTQKIDDFAPGTTFHRDAAQYTTLTADAHLVEEILARLDEFPKLWNRPAQKRLQDFTGNGLFTSSETNEDWQAAHSLLPRGFNQIKVKSFAPQILSKTRAFIREWSAFPAGHTVEHVNGWLTAMTADAVVTCSMGLDMRNVERMGEGKPPHPFVDNFRFGLGYAGATITAKSEYGLKRFIPGFNARGKMQARYTRTKKALEELVDQMVEQTRAGELGGQNSIIRAMLQDKASNGKHVRYGVLYGHVINLMIAGHETTAATLGFTLQLLAENPQCEARALEEVRSVLQGRTEPAADDVPKLQYVEQCFREALRLYSPVTSLTRDAAHDTLLQGHRVFQGERLVVLTRGLHTNPEYWGGEFGDPLSFNPDRFSPEAVKKRHPNAYHPWGFGTRACIGSQFALFEAKTFLASILLHFKLVPVPSYKLSASFEAGGAAPSPANLAIIIHPRPGGPLCAADGSMLRLPPLSADATLSPAKPAADVPPKQLGAKVDGAPMQVLFGSNAGSSQEFASQASSAARRAGFDVSMAALDQAVQAGSMAPDGRLLVVVTSTYNGNPPDNASKFKAWLSSQEDGSLTGLRFAVFGVGNSQWQTYQQFPREVDAALSRCGAQRAYPLGACDVDGASFDSDFDEWLTALLRTVGGAVSNTADEPVDDSTVEEFTVEPPGSSNQGKLLSDIASALAAIEQGREVAAKALGVQLAEHRWAGLEVANSSRELCQHAEGRSVRHVTLRLSNKSAKYRAGDHLEVLPSNDPELVTSVLSVLGLDPAAPITWDVSKGKGSNRSARDTDENLRSKRPTQRCAAKLVLEWIPDLAAVPSRKTIARLARSVSQEEMRKRLSSWANEQERYKAEVVTPQLSLAELLQACKGHLKLSIGELCAAAKPLAPRYYSVSSSPAGAADPQLVTISVGQVEYKTGTGRTHRGLASTLLGKLPVGQVIPGCVRQLASNFHLPADPLAPMVMVGPGTGVAPMMGFLQERESLLKKGTKLGPAVLFFGCRRHDQDYLYQEELAAHLKSGALSELHVAFSREGSQKVYVQDIIFEQRANVWKLLQHPAATVFICGDARSMAPDVRRAFQRVAEDSGGRSEAKAASMMASMVESGRYLEDVWA